MFVKINVSDGDVATLAAIAVRKGGRIVDPRKPWAQVTKEERRKLVKFAIDRLLQESIKKLNDELDEFDRRQKEAIAD